MKKLTIKDIEKMRVADKEHTIFNEKGTPLTKRLDMSKIEETFPDSLLILSDIAYGVDKDGLLYIEKAVVDKFCSSAKEAENYLYEDCYRYALEKIPYFTGVTRFSKPVLFRKVSKTSNFVSVKATDNETFEKSQDTTLSFPEIKANEEGSVSVKAIDLSPISELLKQYRIPEIRLAKIMDELQQKIKAVRAPEFSLKVFMNCIESSIRLVGYDITEDFKPLFHDLAKVYYPRLVSRDNVIVFHSNNDKDFLTNYCNSKEYNFTYIDSNNYDDLLMEMLNDNCHKVVMESKVMESLPLEKTKILGLLAVRCEILVELVSM